MKEVNFNNLLLFVKEQFNALISATKKNSLHVKKACHCNLVFLRRTRLILALNHFIPRCPYYCTYFAFRRTGIHPPFIKY